ncbi:MAG: DUF1552 domain-containing protein, partial [Myxococcota bacterium]
MTRVLRHHRRHFLTGASATLVGIPFLSSLQPRIARAQSNPQKRLFIFLSDHGGVYPQNMYPLDEDVSAWTTRALFPARGDFPAHAMRWAPLPNRTDQGDVHISNTVRARADRLPGSLREKLNVIAGLDFPTYVGHNVACGVMVGNAADNHQGSTLKGMSMNTIDQLVTQTPGFNRTPVARPSVPYGNNAWEVVNGVSQRVPRMGLRDIWRAYFDPEEAGPPARRAVVDRVHQHYRDLLAGAFGDASRLSAADRLKLDHHMERLSALERRLEVVVSCGNYPAPGRHDTQEQLRLAADMIAVAMTCGAVNVGTVGSVRVQEISTQRGWNDWHGQIAHDGGGNFSRHTPAFQRINYRSQRQVFEEIFLAAAQRLDEMEERPGETYLDNSLLYWSMESGHHTHHNFSTPVVTAGSAGGHFETGRFIDYRNHEDLSMASGGGPFTRPGVLVHQFLANVAQSMGLSVERYRAEKI